MLSDEFFDSYVGEDVAVVDEEGILSDEGGDVFDAATGFEENFFVEEVELEPAIGAVGEGAVPFFMEVMGVDGYFLDAGREQVVESMGGHGTMKDGDEGLGDGVGHGLETSSKSGTEEKGFLHVEGRVKGRGRGEKRLERQDFIWIGCVFCR